MPDLKVITFPGGTNENVSEQLRKLADGIDRGEYGDAHNVAWVVDEGHGEISIGLCGKAAEPGTLAYFLYGLAQRKLENV